MGASETLKTNCWIYGTSSTFNVSASITPLFYIVTQESDDPVLIDCNKEYNIYSEGVWEVKGNQGWQAREIPVCEDTPGACTEANVHNCLNSEYIAMNCPATCSNFGYGPAPCSSTAHCTFTPTPTDQCPAPKTFNVPELFPNCMECYNGKPTLCQADVPFNDEDGIEEWQIHNCPDEDGYMYNIFNYDCEEGYLDGLSTSGGVREEHGASGSSFTVDSSSYEEHELQNENSRLLKVNKILLDALHEMTHGEE